MTLLIWPDAAAQFFLLALLAFGVEHFGLGAAGAAALLTADLFSGLPFRTLFAEYLLWARIGLCLLCYLLGRLIFQISFSIYLKKVLELDEE